MSKIFNMGFKDIGIDLGTANILITLKGKGIVLQEPAVVAMDKHTSKVLAVGKDAKEMIGRTPNSILAIRPMKDGVIANYIGTQSMLQTMINKVCKRYNIKRPRVVVGVPSGITEVEERAVEEAVIQAGAKEVFLIQEPIAAALGSCMDVAEPSGNMIVDIGGGTTEVAVISLGGIVVSNSIKVAGDELDENIINYMKKERGLAIGYTMAETIKKEIGCATPLLADISIEAKGRDLNTGLPKTVSISASEVQYAIYNSIEKIVETVRTTIEQTPPELIADISEKGIILTGGGALIKNLDKLISANVQMPVFIANEPLESVAIGAGKTIENMEILKGVLTNIRKK